MSTTFTELTLGEQFLWHERVVELDCIVSAIAARVRDVASGCMKSVPLDELRPVAPPTEREESTGGYVSQGQWDEAKRRYRLLQPYVESATLSRADAANIAKTLGLSERQVRRDFQRLLNLRTVRGLARRKPGPEVCKRRYLTTEQEKAIAEILDQFVLVREPKSVPDLMDDLHALCLERGCPTPSERTVYRRLARIDPETKMRKQHGAKEAKQKFGARPKSFTVYEALDVVQMDHTLVDLNLVSADRFRSYLGRPWLTTAEDVATRCILGFYLSFDAPSAVSVGACLAHATLPKGQWLESIGLPGIRWPMYGKTRRLHTDNGKDFWSLALDNGCADAGIDPVFHRPVGGPHWGGHVERVQGTFMSRVHALPGTTFSNVAERGDYPSERRAIFTLSEMREWLICEIVRYHASPHSGLNGMTPHQAWLKARTDAHGIYQPPPIAASPENFLLQFLPAVPRKVRRGGVEFAGLRYWNDGVAGYIGSAEKRNLYYDPRDISRTYMRNRDGHWLGLTPIDRHLDPISLFEFRAYKARCRKELRDEKFDDLRAETARRQHELVSSSAKKTRQARRMRERERMRLELVKEAQPALTQEKLKMPPISCGEGDDDTNIEIPAVERWDS